MSGKQQQTQQSGKANSPAKKTPVNTALSSPDTLQLFEETIPAGNLGSLPGHGSARSLRQATLLQLQRRHGNAYVQRFLVKNRPPNPAQPDQGVAGETGKNHDEKPGLNGRQEIAPETQVRQTKPSPNGKSTSAGFEPGDGEKAETGLGLEKAGVSQADSTRPDQKQTVPKPEPALKQDFEKPAEEKTPQGIESQQAQEADQTGAASREGATQRPPGASMAGQPSESSPEGGAAEGTPLQAAGEAGPGAAGAGAGGGQQVQPLALSDRPEEAAQQYLNASPSQIAASHAQVGSQIGQKLTQEQAKAKEAIPDLKAQMGGVEKQPEKKKSPELKQIEAKIEAGTGLQEPQKQELKPHEDKAPPPKNEQVAEGLPGGGGNTPGFLSQLKNAFSGLVNQISTRDPGIKTTIDGKPKFEATGKADPDRTSSQAQEGASQTKVQGRAANQHLEQMPGPETVQPQKIDEEIPVEAGKQTVEKPETPQLDELAEFNQMPLPENVRQGVDARMAPMLAPKLAKPKQEVAEAASKRDQDKQKAIDEAERETAKKQAEAEEEQMAAVTGSRVEIQQAKAEGKKQNQELLKNFDEETSSEKQKVHGEVEHRIQEDRQKADEKMVKAEADAVKEKARGEREAAAKKRELENESKNQSWWDRVKSAVKSVMKSITQAIDGIFSAVRKAVKGIIDTAKNAAIALIEAGRKWVVDKLDKFGNWVKDKVNTYVGKYFPGVAKAINDRIDGAINTAKKVVNQVADKLKKAVTAIADKLGKVIDSVLGKFQAAIKGAVAFAGAMLTGDFAEAARIAFETACEIAGISAGPLMAILQKAGDSIAKIFKDPIGFLGNLLSAVKKGFNNFKDNILTHLKKGLLGWLFGTMEEAGIKLPAEFNLKGIFSLVMQVLGLTAERIKAKLTKLIGERGMTFLERAWDFVSSLISEGPGGLLEKAKEFIGGLADQLLETIKTTIIDGIKEWVVVQIVQQAIIKLVTMFNPVGALVQAVMTIYNVIMFVKERLEQIKALAEAIFNSLAPIVAGAIDGAANWIEQTLAKAIPVVISFLARLLNIGGITDKIRGIIERIREKIDGFIDRMLGGIVRFIGRFKGDKAETESAGPPAAAGAGATAGPASATGGAAGSGEQVKSKVRRELSQRTNRRFANSAEARQVLSQVLDIYRPQGLQSLTLAKKEGQAGKFDIVAVASPAERVGVIQINDRLAERLNSRSGNGQVQRATGGGSDVGDLELGSEEQADDFNVTRTEIERRFRHRVGEDYSFALVNGLWTVRRVAGATTGPQAAQKLKLVSKGDGKYGLEVDVGDGKLGPGPNHKKLGILESPGIRDRDGSLERSQSQLTTNLGGGVPDHQAHHLIAVSIAENSVLMKAAAESGYDINRAQNGVMLPANEKTARKVKKPLHSGGHLGSYFAEVNRLVMAQEQNARSAHGANEPWDEKKLLQVVARIEARIRSRLLDMSDPLKLQADDPLKP